MRLLSLKQASCRQTDVVFKESSGRYLIALPVMWALVAGAVWMVIYGHIGGFDMPRVLSVFVGLFLLLFAWLLTNTFRASRRPSNWLMRIAGNEVLIKFRSFQNWKMGEEDVQVIELRTSEIESVREVSERQASRGMNNETQMQRNVYLEIVLKEADTGELEAALAAERGRPGWGSDKGRTKMLDYPVQMAGAKAIRITWSGGSSRVRPGIKGVLAELGRQVKVREGAKEAVDFTPTGLAKLSDGERDRKLIELAQRDRIAAIEAVKVLNKCSTGEAMKRVDEMTGAVKS